MPGAAAPVLPPVRVCIATVDEHAHAPATKIDEDHIPAHHTAFPRLADTSHRRRHVSRPLSTVLLYFATLIHSSAPPRTSSVVAFSARSPVRRCASICHVVIFRRPSYVPAPPLLRLAHFIPRLPRIYAPEHSLHYMPYAHIHSTYKL